MTIRPTIIATILVLATPLLAQTPWQNVHSRKATVEGQIDSGVKGGALTPAEAKKIRAEFASIERQEAADRKSGGALTDDEKTALDARLQVITKRLTEQQSDRQVRR